MREVLAILDTQVTDKESMTQLRAFAATAEECCAELRAKLQIAEEFAGLLRTHLDEAVELAGSDATKGRTGRDLDH